MGSNDEGGCRGQVCSLADLSCDAHDGLLPIDRLLPMHDGLHSHAGLPPVAVAWCNLSSRRDSREVGRTLFGCRPLIACREVLLAMSYSGRRSPYGALG